MINVDKKNIYFLMKDRRRRTSDKECRLLYGLTCGTCSNVILAAFVTDKPIDLWDFEETSVMHWRPGKENGTFNYYYPTVESKKGDSCFESTVQAIPEGGFIQTIRMKNHALEAERTNKKEGEKFEPGERTCTYNAVFSLRKELAMKQAILITGTAMAQANYIDWKSYTEEIIAKNKNNNLFLREAESYGEIPMYGILIPKERIQYNSFGLTYHAYQVKG